jgi:hypothetical protein
MVYARYCLLTAILFSVEVGTNFIWGCVRTQNFIHFLDICIAGQRTDDILIERILQYI